MTAKRMLDPRFARVEPDQANCGSDGVPTESAGLPIEIDRLRAKREALTPDLTEARPK